MKIGVPKEIKPQENRIGLTPESVKTLTANGHEVIVENNGGKVLGTISRKLDLLVVGDSKPTKKKIDQANKLNIKVRMHKN